MNHTPTPYKVVNPCYEDARKQGCLCVQIGEDDLYTTSELKGDDAKFIVLACNAHEELLAACKVLLEIASDAKVGAYFEEEAEIAYELGAAAIAKAEGP